MFSLKGIYKKAIVTGGAGFIGSHLVEELLKDNIEVISIDDYSGGKSENLISFKNNPNFREVNCDITKINELEQYFKEVDIVFNQAASKMTVCLKDPRRDLEVNAKGALNILELSKKYNVKKIVHASTGSVYGKAEYYPTDEKHPLNPTSYYGVSKLAGEKYARAFSNLYDMNITMLRYFHVYGPRQENSDVGGVVSIFSKRAYENKPIIIYGDGTQMRSFTYVKDVVAINKLVAKINTTKGEAYNCASGIKVTIQQLADSILNILNKNDLKIIYKPWKIGDIKVFNVSNTKIKNIGMVWKTDFNEGLHNTLAWTQEWLNNLDY